MNTRILKITSCDACSSCVSAMTCIDSLLIHICMSEKRLIENSRIIPNWCRLEEENKENKNITNPNKYPG